jgi:anti-sigma factor RsiW
MQAYLAGELPPRLARRIEAHLSTCPACRALAEAARQVSAAVAETGRQLTAAILERTSGRPCRRVQERLPDLLEGGLADIEATLLEEHLAACPDCRRLHRTLTWLMPELQAMGEMAPETDLVAPVLERTSRLVAQRRKPEHERSRWWPSRDDWRRLLLRPRIAIEAAYAGCLLLVLLFGTPVSPLSETPGRALGLVQAGPTGLFRDLSGPANLVAGQIGGVAQQVWDGAPGELARRAVGLASDLVVRSRRTGDAWGSLGQNLEAAGAAVIDLDLVTTYEQLQASRRDLRNIWRTWRGRPAVDTMPAASDSATMRRSS